MGVLALVVLGFCQAFFATMGLLGLYGLVRPAELVFSPEGLRRRALWRRDFWAWSEIDKTEVMWNQYFDQAVLSVRRRRSSPSCSAS